MANYYATARTNYFKVKDKKKFEAELEKIGSCKLITEYEKVGILFEDIDCGAIPYIIFDKEGNDTEIDMADLISKHLVKDEVAILVESGAEKQRYITGYAIAINSEGKQVSVNIEDIYDKAKKLGKNITRAEY